MPPTSPRNSMRRLTPLNSDSAAMDWPTETPTWRAAPIAASAFSALCAPTRSQRTVPTGRPASSTTNLEKSPPSGWSSAQVMPWPPWPAKPSRGGQAPRARGLVQRPGDALAALARETFARRPRAHRERGREVCIAGIPQDATRARHGAHQVVELPLDGAEVLVDVGVVELEVVQ